MAPAILLAEDTSSMRLSLAMENEQELSEVWSQLERRGLSTASREVIQRDMDIRIARDAVNAQVEDLRAMLAVGQEILPVEQDEVISAALAKLKTDTDALRVLANSELTRTQKRAALRYRRQLD